MPSSPAILLDAGAIAGTIRRLAGELRECTRGAARVVLVGIRRGGVPLAERLAVEMEALGAPDVAVGTVDIALYRDDAATALPDPKIGPSEIPGSLRAADVVLVDDVLQTGRTIRAAIDCLFDYGRPRRIWLLVLCDRGGRELPIAADFVGHRVEVSARESLDVLLGEPGGDRVERRPA